MEFQFTEEQKLFKKSFHDFVTKECPTTLVRELEESELGYSPELWRKMAELGWMGLGFPEKYGGTGGDFLALCILCEEMGKGLLPSPYFTTAILCGQLILENGSEEQKKKLLSRTATGEIILSLALIEPDGNYTAASINTTAQLKGSDYVLKGTKLFVEYANAADYFICAAETKKGKNKEAGITLFLVDAKSAGVTITPLKTISGEKTCEVLLKNVKVPKKNILGKLNKGWPAVAKVLEQAKVALAARMVGGAQAVFDMTLQYSKERVQFGKVIGAFQEIAFRLADMATELDGARFLTYEAAWMISQGIPAGKEAAMAKAFISEIYRKITAEGIQIHGGFGFMMEGDPQLYYRRAKADEVSLGDGDFNREIIAGKLGL